MSEINGFKCDVCKVEATMNMNDYTGGPTIMTILGFTTLKIGDECEMCICTGCVARLEDVINKLVEQ
jgi:hypothetical protein